VDERQASEPLERRVAAAANRVDDLLVVSDASAASTSSASGNDQVRTLSVIARVPACAA
jgi:hypothetical protein